MYGFLSMSARKGAAVIADATQYLIMKLRGEGYNKDNNKVFLDESNNYFGPITTNGNAGQGSAGPFGTNWSWYFDGNGDYLTVPTSTAFSFGTGDFTVEGWIYKTSATNSSFIDARPNPAGATPWAFYIDANNFPYFYEGTVHTSTAAVTLNAWNHIAVTRSSGTLRIFVNGVQGYSATVTTNLDRSAGLFIGMIANTTSPSSYYAGYMSNLRIVKGTAVYTSNFTPSTSTLTNISGTSLLTCQNGYLYDNSNNRFTVTVNGDAQSRPFGPFAPSEVSVLPYRSVFFSSATADYLSVASNAAFAFGTGNFTIEAWVYMTGTSTTILSTSNAGNSDNNYISFTASTTNTQFQIRDNASSDFITGPGIPINTWTHVAVSKSSGTVRVFANGVSGTATASSKSVTQKPVIINGFLYPGFVGYGNGYLSNLRVNNTALYTSNFTPSTSPLTAVSGTVLLTCQGNTFSDGSTNNFAVTSSGSPRVTANSPFSLSTTTTSTTAVSQSWSGFFDGTNSWFTVPANANLNVFGGSFTIECMIYPITFNASSYNYIACQDDGGSSSQNFVLRLSSTGQILFIYYTSSNRANAITLTSSNTIPLNAWSHIAVTNNGTTVQVFANGVQVASSSSQPWAGANVQTAVGNWSSGANQTTTFSKLNAYVSNVRLVKGTAVYTSNFTPPTADLTAISGTGLLTLQSSRFIDNSSNSFTLTTNGNVATRMFGPYLSTGSMSFDATTTSYVSATMPAAIGTGDFTVECWAYFTATGKGIFHIATASVLPSTVTGIAVSVGASGWGLYWANSQNTSTTGTNRLNAWNHIAVTRSGTTTRLFINGVIDQTQLNDSTNYTGTSVAVGAFFSTAYTLNGNISNFRIVRGTALYTAAFTPPASPLTAVANTSILVSGTNNFLDTSGNNVAITPAAAARIQTNNNGLPISPYAGNYSVQFSGSNYLTVPNSAGLNLDSSDFTIECWFYPTATPSASGHMLFTKRANTSSFTAIQILFVSNLTPQLYVSTTGSSWWPSIPTAAISCTLNNWNHIAVTRFGDNYRLFINGQVSVAATLSGSLMSNSDAFSIAAGAANGGGPMSACYISNFRVVKGTALYTTTFTPPTSALTAVSGTTLLTCQSNRFIDNSSVAATITAVSSPTIVNAFDPYDNLYSYFFNGSSDYITSTASNLYAFGTGDFTVEAWIYQTARTSPANQIVGTHTAGTGANWILYTNNAGNLLFYVSTGANTSVGTFTSTSTVPLNQWVHVAATRTGGTIRLFLNGADAGGSGASAQNVGTNYNLGIGAANNGSGTFFSGYISNVRVTKGTARYTAAFTPSTAPLTTSAQTVLLTGQGNSFTDASGNNVFLTPVSTVRTDPFTPFSNTISTSTTTTAGTLLSGSYFFDGTGDYLSIPANAAFVPAASEDFTIEFWYRATSTPSSPIGILTSGWPGSGYAPFLFYWNTTTNRISFYASSAFSAWDIANDQTIISAPKINQWYHIVASRRNGVIRLFGNGVLATSISSNAAMYSAATYPVTVGAGSSGSNAATGFVSNLRILRGAGLYTNSFIPPSTPGQTLASSALTLNFRAAGIYDSVSDTIFETLGDASVSTVQERNGNSSMFFDGTGDYLTAANRELSWGTGDFTVEFWMYSADVSAATQRGTLQTSTTAGGLVNNYTSGLALGLGTTCSAGGVLTATNGGIGGALMGVNFGSPTAVLTANTWAHIAVVRRSGVVTLYVNGTSVDSRSITNNVAATQIAVGGYFSTAYLYSGYLDDLQIYSGYAKYTGNFTPPVRS